MDAICPNACGLDIHEAVIVACLLIDEGKANPTKHLRKFSTMRRDIVEMRQWLIAMGVTAVVMEGTGIYWRPVYEMLEGGPIDLWVVNARHVKNVPGRKSDVIDAQWLATLLRNGLLRKSFVPCLDVRILRDMTRYRRSLVQMQTSQKNRILKLLETMGVKLSAVACDVFGISGMAMLRAIASGTSTTDEIAQLARGRLRQKLPELRLALECVVLEYHRLMLRDQLAHLDATAAQIAKYEGILEEQIKPYEDHISRLCTIDGVQRTAAIEIFAEIGPNLATFPSDRHFSAWAGTSPGLSESAGKRKRGRRRRGNSHLASILMECALAATKKKGRYLSDKYRRLTARRPKLTALFAIANKIARAVYRVVTTGESHRDLGAAYLDRRNAKQTARNLIRRLLTLGIDETEIAKLASQQHARLAPAPLQ